MTDTFYVATVNFIDKNRKWNTSVAGVYLSISTEESIYISAETYYLNEAFPEGF